MDPRIWGRHARKKKAEEPEAEAPEAAAEAVAPPPPATVALAGDATAWAGGSAATVEAKHTGMAILSALLGDDDDDPFAGSVFRGPAAPPAPPPAAPPPTLHVVREVTPREVPKPVTPAERARVLKKVMAMMALARLKGRPEAPVLSERAKRTIRAKRPFPVPPPPEVPGYEGPEEQQARIIETLAAAVREELAAGRPQEARRLCDEALASYRKSHVMRKLLGDAYAAMGNPLAAEEAYKAATELRPEYTDAHIGLGVLFVHARRWPDAARSLERAVILDRSSVAARYHLALTYMAQNLVPRANAQIYWLTRIAPEDLAVALLQATMHERTGAHAEAVTALREVLGRKGVDAATAGQCHLRIGKAKLALGDRQTALADFQAALAADPAQPLAHAFAGKLFEERRRPQQAKAHYEAILRDSSAGTQLAARARQGLERISAEEARIAATMAGDGGP